MMVPYGNRVAEIKDFARSWKDGSAFLALMHTVFPESFKFDEMLTKNIRERLVFAFDFAEERGIVGRLLEPDDFIGEETVPEKLTVETYISCIYHFHKKRIGDDQLDAQLKSLLANIDSAGDGAEGEGAAWSLQTMDAEIESLNNKMKILNESQKTVEKRRNESAQSKETLNNLEKIIGNIERELEENEAASKKFREEIEKRELEMLKKIEKEKEQYDRHIIELQRKIESLKSGSSREQEELKKRLDEEKRAKEELLKKKEVIEAETLALKQRLDEEQEAKRKLEESWSAMEEEKRVATQHHQDEIRKLREELVNSNAKQEIFEMELRSEMALKGDLVATQRKIKDTVGKLETEIDAEVKEKAEISRTKEKLTSSLKKAIMTLEEETSVYNLRDKTKKEMEAEKTKLRAEREAESIRKIGADKDKRIAENELNEKKDTYDLERTRIREARFLNADLERKVAATEEEIEDEKTHTDRLLKDQDERFGGKRETMAKRHEKVLKKIEDSKASLARKKADTTESISKERDRKMALERQKEELAEKEGDLAESYTEARAEKKAAGKSMRGLEEQLNRAKQFLDLESKGRSSREKFRTKLEIDAKAMTNALGHEQAKKSAAEDKKASLEKDEESLAKKLRKAQRAREELEETKAELKAKAAEADEEALRTNKERAELETELDLKILKNVATYQEDLKERVKAGESRVLELETKAFLAQRKRQERKDALAEVEAAKDANDRQLREIEAKLEETLLEHETGDIRKKKLEEDVKKAKATAKRETKEREEKAIELAKMREEIARLTTLNSNDESERSLHEDQARLLAKQLAEEEEALREKDQAIQEAKAEAELKIQKEKRRLEKEKTREERAIKQELLDEHKEKLKSMETKFDKQKVLLEEEYKEIGSRKGVH
eukprot:gene1156-1322_t